MTLSCIEVGRSVTDEKVRGDHHKLLLKGKCIINNTIKNFPFIDPKSISAFNLQICGMKGDFIETILGNKKEYVAHRPLNRLRAPHPFLAIMRKLLLPSFANWLIFAIIWKTYRMIPTKWSTKTMTREHHLVVLFLQVASSHQTTWIGLMIV